MIEDTRTLADILYPFIDFVYTLFPVLELLAFLVFLWGLVKFVARVGGDESAVKEGKSLMVWGVIALFLMISFQTVIAVFYGDLGFGDTRSFGIPYLPVE